jgi:alpha-glucosidase (family GH31 glycosyl hydrolase)
MKFMDGVAHEQRDKDEAFMVEKGYGVRKGDGSLYRIPNYEWFRGSLVPDFTNPEASEWWLGKRRYLLEDMNIDGFKTDGGECIYGSDLIFHYGRTVAEMRNEYPNVYVGAFQQYADRYVRGGAITFSRAGYTGAQGAPLHWAGDEKSTFEAFRATIIAGLSCGMSGIPFWGWDLGGFSGDIPTAELFVRSAAMAAFCPVMQYHAESKGQFNMDRTPWNIAERTGEPAVLTIYKRFADMRMNMLPYIYEQARISSETGFPMMRAMLLAYPDDPRCRDLTMQYLFGESMLVAPVTEEGAAGVRVYFPEGQWLSLFEPEMTEGGEWREVAAELSHIPAYLKENSVIPLNLGTDCELADDVGNRTDRYERLCLMIFLTSELHYRFADDLGYDVAISAAKHEDRMEADVEAKGNGPITLLFRGLGRDASSATWNGKALDRVDGIGELAAGRWLRRKGDEVVIVVPASSGKLAIGFGL